jgi:hypothetical protein
MTAQEKALAILQTPHTREEFCKALWPTRYRLERDDVLRAAGKYLHKLHAQGLVSQLKPQGIQRVWQAR